MKRFKVLPGNLPINNRWNNQHEIFKKYSNSLAQPLLFYSLSLYAALPLSLSHSPLAVRVGVAAASLPLAARLIWFIWNLHFWRHPQLPRNPRTTLRPSRPLLEFGSSLQLAFLNMLHTFVRCEACSECESGASGATLFRIPVNISITFR